MPIASIEAALTVAIEKEDQARQFYDGWSKRVKDPGAAALLRDLAAEEVKHKERLEQARAGGRPETLAGPAPATLGLADTLVERDLSADATTQDVLIAAMNREKRAQAMYTDLGKWAKETALKELLRLLAQEEAGHLARLEAVYDALVLSED